MSEQIESYVSQYEAGYAGFRRTYEVRYPMPERVIIQGDNRLSLVALGVMVLASVIVSGSRTIAEFGGGVVGVSSFIMLEVGVVVYAFIRTREDYDAARDKSVKKLVNRGMWLSFGAAASANLHATLKQNGIDMPEVIDLAILVILALSAPTLALIAGDVFGMYAVKDAVRQRKSDDVYRVELAAWNEGLRLAWDANKSRWAGKLEVSNATDRRADASAGNYTLSSGVLSEQTQQTDRQTDGQTPARAGFGHNRTSDGQQRVIEHLNANPQDARLPLRELGKVIGVNKDTASAGRKAWQAQLPPDAANDGETVASEPVEV